MLIFNISGCKVSGKFLNNKIYLNYFKKKL
jgi:hypothetical protein